MICSLKRIRRRAGRTIGSASQEFLRVVAEDERGRSLEVVTEWQGTYVNKCVRLSCLRHTYMMSISLFYTPLGYIMCFLFVLLVLEADISIVVIKYINLICV